MIGWAILKAMGGWDGKPTDFTIMPPPQESGVEKLKRMLGFKKPGPRSP